MNAEKKNGGVADGRQDELRVYLEQLLGQKVGAAYISAIYVNPPYHGQNKRWIEVGKAYRDLEPGRDLEPVLAIFESKAFLLVTESRGNLRDVPIIFTRNTVLQVRSERG